MALSGNEPKIRFMDMIYTVKKRIVTDITRLLEPYSQTAVECEDPVEAQVSEVLPAIYFCPRCKQFFNDQPSFESHMVYDKEENVVVHEMTGFNGQSKALKAWFAD